MKITANPLLDGTQVVCKKAVLDAKSLEIKQLSERLQ
jgi:hypothetical protein